MDAVDVLIVTALPVEFEAARRAALAPSPNGPGVGEWVRRDADGSAPYLWGEYRAASGGVLRVALARATGIGGRNVGAITTTLTNRLHPTCLSMCGVCAGNPAETALGDVVVAEVAYEWDEGKQFPSVFVGDHRQAPLDPVWVRAVQDFDPAGLPSHGPAGAGESKLWLLERLRLGQDPRRHPARDQFFPPGTWQSRLEEWEKDGLITRDPDGAVTLTATGATLISRRMYDDVDGPERLPYRVRVAPMASGSAVLGDGQIWDRLTVMGVRTIAAVEMEAATIATVARERRVPFWLVAKGVMDHASVEKDDRYKAFAARASAEVLFALLPRLLLAGPPGVEAPDRPGSASAVGAGPRRPGSGPAIRETPTRAKEPSRPAHRRFRIWIALIATLGLLSVIGLAMSQPWRADARSAGAVVKSASPAGAVSQSPLRSSASPSRTRLPPKPSPSAPISLLAVGKITTPGNNAKVPRCIPVRGTAHVKEGVTLWLVIQVPTGDYLMSRRITLSVNGQWQLANVTIGGTTDTNGDTYELLVVYTTSGTTHEFNAHLNPGNATMPPEVITKDRTLSQVTVSRTSLNGCPTPSPSAS